MKKKFSKYWKASKQPRKQRKYAANAPLHIRKRMISSNLSKELRKKYEKRNFPLRKGDIIKIMVGEFRGKSGKVDCIRVKKRKIVIEGIQKTKKDGTKVNVIFDPSNLQILELNLEDKQRIKSVRGENKTEEKIWEEESAEEKEKKPKINLKNKKKGVEK